MTKEEQLLEELLTMIKKVDETGRQKIRQELSDLIKELKTNKEFWDKKDQVK